MQYINSNFARFYNKIESRVGYVFKDRYFAQEIKNRTHLFNTIAYIHNNPVKAKIVTHPKEYKYSSYNSFINEKVNKEIIIEIFETEKYLDFFNYIHKNFDESTFVEIIDGTEENLSDVLQEFLNKTQKNLNEIKENDDNLIEIIKELKIRTKKYNKEIAEILGINKNKMTKLYKKIIK